MTPDLEALGLLWRQRDRVVVLQTGFGNGDAFLRLWQAWRADLQRRAQLHVIAVDPAPAGARAIRLSHPSGPLAPLADALALRWPPLTRNLHHLAFEHGRVQLLVAVGQAMDMLPQLQAQVDAFLIDGVDLCADPRAGAQRLCKALARLAAPEASLALALPLGGLRRSLLSAGFRLREAPVAGALEADDQPAAEAPGTAAVSPAAIHAIYAPRFVPRRRVPPSERPAQRHALIVGAGLAGCAVACALAEQGWRSTLIERNPAPAQEGSGNPAGLFHGVVNAQDGAHARFNRAAALQSQHAVQQAIAMHGAKGSQQGLLRLETSGKDHSAMRAELAALQLPGDYVQALDAAEASRRCGLSLQHPAWFYPGGGWVDPAALARSFVQRAGTATHFRGSLVVQALRRRGAHWQLLDGAGQVIDEAATVVLANAADALRLLRATHWPVQQVRGQISLYANEVAPPAMQMRLPLLPLAGAGYLLPEIDGQALFGATSHPGDDDGAPRDADHASNLLRLQSLSPHTLQPSTDARIARQDELQLDLLTGKVGWRCVAVDRLPLLGAVPDEAALATRNLGRAREAPRLPGLHVFSALASRGISWAALGGQVLAAQISGAPVPLEASLVDAVDPARFALRATHRSVRGPDPQADA